MRGHRRPTRPLPLEVLLLGADVRAVVILVWLATGPILATLALTLPASIMFRADDGVSVAEASWMAAAVLLATVLVAVAYIWTRRQRE